MSTGTPGADQFSAPGGSSTFDGLGGRDTISFNFKLTDASLTWIGNKVIVDTATSHTVLTGFEVYQFTDGTVNDDDGNPLVDDLYYYAQYHDVWALHVDADAHYAASGWREKRDPDAFFNTKLYLSIYSDVASSGLTPAQQYDQTGWKQDRLTSLDFDARQYLLSNPDVAAAHVDPLAHFLNVGAGEGRQATARLTYTAANGFDYVYYLTHNPDVAAAGVDPLQHFQTVGWKEGRNPNAFFDTAGYLASNPDIAAKGINPLDHFHQYGWREGRLPSPAFDPQQYLAHNPDVAAVGLDPLQHYLAFGIYEGRSVYAAPISDTNGAANLVNEGAASGTSVGLTVSWGNWKSPSLSYTLSGDTSGGGFAIDAKTGAVSVLDGSKLDFETSAGHAYTLTVTAHDGDLTSTQTFTIQIGDVSPEPSQAPIGVVDEGAANGSSVGVTFTVREPNGPAPVYALTDDAGGRFAIDSQSGVVTVANGAAIDYETAPDHAYTVVVQATAGASVSSQTISITVRDVNDAPSAVSFANAVAAIDENSDVGTGTKVADVLVTDDALGSATLSLSGADSGFFELRGGALYFIGASPDFETKASYAVTVEANDPAVGSPVDAAATFTLHVNDIDEAPTGVLFANAIAAIDENVDVGTGIKVADVQLADDALGATTLSLSGADSGLFELRGTELYFIGPSPDFETKTSYTVTVDADDPATGGAPDASASFTLGVNDLNDNTPAIGSAAVMAVDENAASGTLVGTVVATDLDATAPNNTITYTVTGGTGLGLFEVDATTGKVTVADGAVLDRETADSYTLVVKASDGTLFDTQTLTINLNDLNDNTSAISSAAAMAVDENVLGGTLVGTVVATDADATAPNSTITYTVTGGSGLGLFDVDATTGKVTVADGAVLDREAADSYTLDIKASDGTLFDTQTLVISLNDLNDNAPSIGSADTMAVDENAAGGTLVGAVVATDADATVPYKTTIYVATGGSGFGLFDVDAVTGKVTVAAGAVLDREATGSYTLEVTASDGTLSGTQTLTISLNDLNDNTPAISSAAAMAVDENAAGGTLVGTVVATDLDATAPNSTITYTATGGTGFGLFDVDATTGKVTVADGAVLDREAADSYTLEVKASDGTLFDTQTLTISLNDLNDNTPSITSADTMAVDENAAGGTLVGTVVVTDLDATAPDSTITYTATGGTGFGLFDVDAATGKVTVADGAVLDREAAASYTLDIKASDGTLFDTQTLTISLNDLNESAPVFSSGTVATAAEDVSDTTVLYTAIATDADATASLTYSLVDDANGLFAIGATGEVTLASGQSLDRETAASHSFTVEVSDGPHHTTRTVTLSVTDVNEATPVFTSGTITTAAEDVNDTTVLYTAAATDADATASLSYSLTDDAGGLFEIDAATGQVTLASGKSLDRETTASHSFTVTVSDGLHQASRTVTLSVTDVNESAPVVTSDATMTVDENALGGTLVGTVVATDLDATAPNNTITYTATGGTGLDLFDIDPVTGQVTLKSGAVLDYEQAASFTLEVTASDGGTPGLFSTQILTISLNDVNEAPTAVSFANAVVTIPENTDTSGGIKVADVLVTDDALGSEILTLSGADAASFELRGSALYFIGAAPDFETKASYAVTVLASDPTVIGSNAVSASFTLGITDVNEVPNFAPTVQHPIADQYATLDELFSFQLPADTFHDDNIGDVLTLSATLADGSPLPAWLQFDAQTGTFCGTASAADHAISVKVTATDSGGLSTSDTFEIGLNHAPVFGASFTRGLGIVSTNAAGVVGDADSGYVSNPHFTADGHSVIFFGNADNLVPNDNNGPQGATDIFLKNLDTGAITLLSTDSNGNQINGYSYGGVLSADGRYMAFTTSAQLAAADTNNLNDIYLKDLQTGAITLVSHSFGGGASNSVANPANVSSNISAISADGRYVVFFSDANNLVAGDGAAGTDLFRWDRTTGSITLLTNTVHHNSVYSQWHLSISVDGRYVTYAVNVGGQPQNFVLDTNPGGALTQINTLGYYGDSLSADGHYVAYMRDSQIYRMDLTSGLETPVSVDANGDLGNNSSDIARISANGRYVAFASYADNLVAGDTNGAMDVFVRDMVTGVTRLVNISATGQQTSSTDQLGFLDVSNDGEATFVSTSSVLVPGDTNNASDVFATNMLVSGGSGTAGNITEVVGAPASGTQLSTSAAFGFSDVDVLDTHHLVSATATFNAGASQHAASALGVLTASIVNDTVNGGGGQLSWNYSVDAALIEYLAPGETRVEAFDVSLADSAGGIATQTILITLTGVNDPPVVAHPIADQLAVSESPFQFRFDADTFSDPDGQTLTYSATLDNGAPLPTWLTFDSATRTFSGTPHFGDGLITVKVTASDGQASVSDSFKILLPVYNHAPVLAPLPGPADTLTKQSDISAMASAMVLDGHFGVSADANVTESATIPHVNVQGLGTGTLDYYKFTVAAGARGIFDIDGGYDSVINLIDSNGNLIDWNDDFTPLDPGSPANNGSTTYDSYLDHTFTTGGTYYLVVGGYNGGTSTPNPITSGTSYQLHVSLTGTGGAPALQAYEANGGAPSGVVGTLVSSLVDLKDGNGIDNVTDSDASALTGIALSGVTAASNGRWWYSLDNGAHWDLVGSVDEQHALLLAADSGTRLYFQPASGVTGQISDAITFHAWDQSSGQAGHTADASINGGATAFSATTDTLSTKNVNHAPVAHDKVIYLSDALTTVVLPFASLLYTDTDQDGDTLTIIGTTDLTGVTGQSLPIGVGLNLESLNTLFMNMPNNSGSSGDLTGNSFTYTISDGNGGTSTATVTVKVMHVTSGANTTTLADPYAASYIDPHAGNDTVTGGAGNDVFVASMDTDTFNGGAGFDIISFRNTNAVSFTLQASGSVSYTVPSGSSNIPGTVNYSNFEGVIGSFFDDTLIGSSGNDLLDGSDGNDVIRGGAGNDRLSGGTYLQIPGNDIDMLDMSDATGPLHFTLVQGVNPVKVDLTDVGLGIDTYDSFEGVIGSAFADEINGSSGDDVLVGGLGDDKLSGYGGNDTFRYAIGDGADVIDGGQGDDTLVIVGTTGPDTLNFVVSGGAIVSGVGGLTLTSIEHIALDLLAGTDTLSYAGTTEAVTVDLKGGTATGFSSIAGVENITGGSGNDILSGDSNANVIIGGAGDDTINYVAGDGADTVDGGTNTAAGDTLNITGTSGADMLGVIVSGGVITSVGGGTINGIEKVTLNLGGNSSDTLSYAGTTEGIQATVGGTATGFFGTIASVENLTGGDGVDTLTGNSAANVLKGNGGADILIGGAGADTLTGGLGADHFNYSSGDTAVSIGGSGASGTVSGYDVITDFDVTTDVLGLVGTPFAATNTSGVNGIDSTLRTGSSSSLTVKSHAISNGMISFSNSDTFGSPVTLTSSSQVAAVVQYLRANDLGNGGVTVAFTATFGGAHTFIYQQVGDTPSTQNDILIDLQGVTLTSAGTSLATLIGTHIDPIVLDLGAPGFALSSLEDGVRFDMDGDGVRDHVAWTSGADGILAFDVDGSGRIDSGTEIFTPNFAGGHFADGLAALASLDSNHDGRIDAADASFGKLVVWQDLNHDGVSDAGELTSLVNAGITAISLAATPADGQGDGHVDGQTLLARGAFTRADGSHGDFIEVAFDWRQVHHPEFVV